MSEKNEISKYPFRAPKKFTKKSLHGRVRTAYLLYSDLKRAQKFYINVFGWDMFKLPQNVLGRCPAEETPDVICASGPAQAGWEGAVPGYMPVELIYKDAENDKPFVMLEVSMNVPLQETVDEVVAAGGKLIKMGGDTKGAWADVATVEDPAGNRLLLWKCPDSRTWEEPEADYDKE